jgi:hypothetical protein
VVTLLTRHFFIRVALLLVGLLLLRRLTVALERLELVGLALLLVGLALLLVGLALRVPVRLTEALERLELVGLEFRVFRVTLRVGLTFLTRKRVRGLSLFES